MYRFSSVTAMENSSWYFLSDGTEATFIYKHRFSSVSAMENSFGMSFSGVRWRDFSFFIGDSEGKRCLYIWGCADKVPPRMISQKIEPASRFHIANGLAKKEVRFWGFVDAYVEMIIQVL